MPTKILAVSALIAWMVSAQAAPLQPAQGASCKFSVTPSRTAPTIVGPDAVTSHLVIVSQPDSPVEIVVADFTGTTLTLTGNSFTFQQSASPTVDVRNRSDATVTHIDIGVSFGPCRTYGRGGRGPTWNGVLQPGATAHIAPGGSGGGVGGGISSGMGGQQAPAFLFLWIDRIDVTGSGADCIFRPSQTIPLSICGPDPASIQPRLPLQPYQPAAPGNR